MEILISASIGLLIAVVTAWITVKLSLKQFRAEKIWERKFMAYENIITALHHSKAFSDTYIKVEMEIRELTEDQERELRIKTKNAEEEIDKAIDVGILFLSENAIGVLKKYRQEADKANSVTSWSEYLQKDSEAIGNCLKIFPELARKDLKIFN